MFVEMEILPPFPKRRVETICGSEEGFLDGSWDTARFNCLQDIALNPRTQELYVADGDNHVIRKISLKDRTVSTLCGTPQTKGHIDGKHNEAKFFFPTGLALDIASNCLYATEENFVVRKIFLGEDVKVTTLSATPIGASDDSTFEYAAGILLDPYSPCLYVLQTDTHRLRRIVDRTRKYN